jgi:3-deoxy-7-phosphoheptulonate synthase
MRSGASQKEIDAVAARVKEEGFGTHLVQGTERTIVCVLGDGRPVDQCKYDVMAGVEKPRAS